MVVVALLGCMVYRYANAKTKITCFWKRCQVIQDAAAACSTASKGTTDQMQNAERKLRGPGSIVLRECVFGEEVPMLDWETPMPFMIGRGK